MPLGDSFILTLSGSNGPVQTRNVFQYQRNEPGGTLQDAMSELAAAFEEEFFDGSVNALDSGLFFTTQTWDAISIYPLGDPSLFYDLLIAYTGTQATGQQMPRFVSYAFRTAKSSRGIRRGQKRFSGVPEAAANAGSIEGTYVANLAGLANKLGNTISLAVGGTRTFTPIVIKRVQYITPKGTIAYRFPETTGEFSAFIADSWESLPRVTTQNSRKPGVGI